MLSVHLASVETEVLKEGQGASVKVEMQATIYPADSQVGKSKLVLFVDDQSSIRVAPPSTCEIALW